MRNLKTMLLLLLLMLGETALGQAASTDKELKIYLQSLKNKNINSYVVVEQGCQDCKIEYDSRPFPDDKIIYVLTETDNKITIQRLEKNKVHLPITLNSSSVFKMLEQRENAFASQDRYHKDAVESEKTLKFVAPHPKYYPYCIIKVNLPKFKNEVKIIGKEYNSRGTYVSNEKWFAPIKEVIEHIIYLAQ